MKNVNKRPLVHFQISYTGSQHFIFVNTRSAYGIGLHMDTGGFIDASLFAYKTPIVHGMIMFFSKAFDYSMEADFKRGRYIAHLRNTSGPTEVFIKGPRAYLL